MFASMVWRHSMRTKRPGGQQGELVMATAECQKASHLNSNAFCTAQRNTAEYVQILCKRKRSRPPTAAMTYQYLSNQPDGCNSAK